MVDRKLWRIVAALCVFVLIGAACGSSASDVVDSATDAVEDGADAATDAAEEAVDDATDAAEDAMEDVEDAVSSGGAIDDNNVLNGPSGFTIDLNDCPSDWSDTAGVTDSEIVVAQSFAQSGTLASYGPWADAHGIYFEHINETEGGIDGRKIKWELKDDAYEPARTVSNVQEFIDTLDPFFFTTIGGSPNNLAVYDTINEACIPQLFTATGHPAWGDPNNHPWTIGSFLAYNTEGSMWVSYIESQVESGELEAPVDVAALVMNNDFGLAYKVAFEEAANASDVIGELTFELHDPQAPNVTNEMTTLAGSEADAVIAQTASVYCTQAMEGVAQASWDPPVKIMAGVCSSIDTYFEPAGDAGVGWVVALYDKDLNDPAFDDDADMQALRDIIIDSGNDPGESSNYGKGLGTAIPTVEALKRAAELPGGLTRTNLMIAARTADFQNEMYLDGIRWKLDGAIDAYPIEGAQFSRYIAVEGSNLGTFEPIGDLINVEGQSGLCHYVDAICINE